MKSLNQGSNKSASPNQSISFNDKVICDPRKIAIAAKFNKQFTSVVNHSSSRTARKLTCKIKARSNNDSPKFTAESTAETIKQAKASVFWTW